MEIVQKKKQKRKFFLPIFRTISIKYDTKIFSNEIYVFSEDESGVRIFIIFHRVTRSICLFSYKYEFIA